MASVAESLFADDARSRRKKKKRNSSKQIDATIPGKSGGGGSDAADVDAAWQEFTSPDGRTYYYNQVTSESRWKLPRALRQKQEQADKASDQQKREVPTPTEPTKPTPMPTPQRRENEKGREDKPTGSAGVGRGDVVARLQASLAGRLNPMAGGPPPMIKIPRSVPDANDGSNVERSHPSTSNGAALGGDSLFSSATSETPEAQYDAETAGMTPAERLRFIRRKRQESMFQKEKIVEKDDFMKEYATNMKKKEAERVQRMTPEALAKEQQQREADAKKRRDDEAQRKKREAQKEEAEAEREMERQRRKREEEMKAKEEEELQRQHEQKQREEQERDREEEEKEKWRQEKEEKRRQQEEHEHEQKEQERQERQESVRQRSRTISSSSMGVPTEDTDDEMKKEAVETPVRRRSKLAGSKTFASEVVDGEAHRSRPSSHRSVIEEPEDEISHGDTTPTTKTAELEPLSVDTSEPIDVISETLEATHLEEETAEEAEERAARKERRKRKKERRRRLEDEEQSSEDASAADHQPAPHSAPPTANGMPSHCHCAACTNAHASHHFSPHHHFPPPSHHHPSPGSHGSYPYYPPHYPPSPYYPPPPPPPMYGYGMPPTQPSPFFPMYGIPPPPPQMLYPPNMLQMPMLMAPPGSTPPTTLNSTTGAIMAVSPYAAYAPPILSQCEVCRGRSVGLAEKNGLCAHCNRLRLDFIVASAQIRTRCASCGGWGLGLVQSDGRCAHCTRVASQVTTGQPPSTPGDWDASSSDGSTSDWDE